MAKGRVLTVQNLTAAQRDDLQAMQQAGGATVQVIPQPGNLFTIVATYPDTNDPPAGGAPAGGGGTTAVGAPAGGGGAPAAEAPAAGASPGGNVGSPVMNDAGFNLLRKWEGCILFAYDDANDRRVNPGDTVQGTLTIGYGHTGPGVVPGLT